MDPQLELERLAAVLGRYPTLDIAVSGGVDSVTLATVAHRLGHVWVRVFHAASPAVPESARAIVEEAAAREGWDLSIIDAGEFADPAYLANPVNRCFFCKTHLYDRIRAATDGTIASGTNLDDLSDFRPGLAAAERHGVVHPFVLAGHRKSTVRAIAAWLGLHDVADLPAQPCLSSRIETGIPVSAPDLVFVDAMERGLAALLPYKATLRCRIRAGGVAIEVEGVAAADTPRLEALAQSRCRDAGRPLLGLQPYRRSSAFLRQG